MKTNDNTVRLKTYKIKNHDSGQTFRVKAVSYTDAKMKYNMHILKDSITEDADMRKVYFSSTVRDPYSDRGFTEMNKIRKAMILCGGQKMDQLAGWIEVPTNKVEMAKTLLNNINTLKNIQVKDSITEDAISKLVQNYLSSKNPKTKAEQDEIINFLLERNKITKEDVQKVRSLLKIVKDSIIEDAYVYPTNASTAMAASFAKLCVEKFGGKVGSKGGNKYVYIAQDKETANKAKRFLEEKYKTSLPTVGFIVGDSLTEDAYALEELAQGETIAEYAHGLKKYNLTIKKTGKGQEVKISGKKEDIVRYFTKEIGIDKSQIDLYDSITEDADIAQNDIKSSYLPEDANADNIQYLGFNEKRKLSFYGYGDRYFVHYDLEGRTEEIDKTTVQKILKKNILGEIDENDLINKEPQSEEIVADTLDWKERGDR